MRIAPPPKPHSGSCLCGAVTFKVRGDLAPPTACHCHQCRKVSGSFDISTEVKKTDLTVHGSESLTWYHTEKVRRGFCKICGCHLFFDPPHRDWISVAMGAFDSPTGVTVALHIFVDDKGDYYEIADGAPQNPQ